MYTLRLNDFLRGFPLYPMTVKPSMRPLYVCLGLKFGCRSMAAEQATQIILCYREGLKQSMGAESRRSQSPPEPRDSARAPKSSAEGGKKRIALLLCAHAVKGRAWKRRGLESMGRGGGGVCVCPNLKCAFLEIRAGVRRFS